MTRNAILIVRSDSGMDDVCRAVENKGYKPLPEPVLRVRYLPENVQAASPKTGLIFTSVNGVVAYAQAVPSRANPVFTVGPETAEAARRAGFSDIRNAHGTARDLSYLIAAQGEDRRYLYLRGVEISFDLANALRGISIAQTVAYETVPAISLAHNTLDALRGGTIFAIMFFSKRGAETFAILAGQAGFLAQFQPIKALCLGAGMVQSVSVLPFGAVLVAKTPDRAGLLDLLDTIRPTQETL